MGVLRAHFVGLSNYIGLLHDPVFIGSVERTLYFTVVTVVPGVLCALGVAMLLTKEFRGRSLARMLMLIPWATPGVATGIMWHFIYSPSSGILDVVLEKMGLINHNIVWTGTQLMAINSVAFAQLWALIPFLTLILLAGLQRVPLNLQRAARVDGAGRFARFRHVTLPTIRYPLVFACLVQTMWSLRVFDVIFILTQGGPANGTTTLNYYAFEQSFEFLNMGTGSAAAIVIAAVTLLTTLGYMMLMVPAERQLQ
jgi:ABC-type sugar transport system permease subunit